MAGQNNPNVDYQTEIENLGITGYDRSTHAFKTRSGNPVPLAALLNNFTINADDVTNAMRNWTRDQGSGGTSGGGSGGSRGSGGSGGQPDQSRR